MFFHVRDHPIILEHVADWRSQATMLNTRLRVLVDFTRKTQPSQDTFLERFVRASHVHDLAVTHARTIPPPCADDFQLLRFSLYLDPCVTWHWWGRAMVGHLSVQNLCSPHFVIKRALHSLSLLVHVYNRWKDTIWCVQEGPQRQSHVFRAHDARTSSAVSHVLPITPKITVSCVDAYSSILVALGSRLCLDLSTKTCSSLERDRWGLDSRLLQRVVPSSDPQHVGMSREELGHVIFCYSAQLFLVESNFEVRRSTSTKQSSSIASVSITTDFLENVFNVFVFWNFRNMIEVTRIEIQKFHLILCLEQQVQVWILHRWSFAMHDMVEISKVDAIWKTAN